MKSRTLARLLIVVILWMIILLFLNMLNHIDVRAQEFYDPTVGPSYEKPHFQSAEKATKNLTQGLNFHLKSSDPKLLIDDFTHHSLDVALYIVLGGVAVFFGVLSISFKKDGNILVAFCVAQLIAINVVILVFFGFSVRSEIIEFSLEQRVKCRETQMQFNEQCQMQNSLSLTDYISGSAILKEGEKISSTCSKLISSYLYCDTSKHFTNYFQVLNRVMGRSAAEVTNAFFGNLTFSSLAYLILFANIIFAYVLLAIYLFGKVIAANLDKYLSAKEQVRKESVQEHRRIHYQNGVDKPETMGQSFDDSQSTANAEKDGEDE
ncbi:hypothetical protein FDP41_005028 [Naegleria fowleri]|uniref:Uncharacterized protein n=1 Tax=Naegleria fowleri TaxID=5763 RepID=A0A6A5BN24_NAEFO|nr:uncharacterized protein FDP41_005028 [Naegleria fowleri]KAF0975701.1 hypothetical protein FDP41_005028 [Naegleria fowleri]